MSERTKQRRQDRKVPEKRTDSQKKGKKVVKIC